MNLNLRIAAIQFSDPIIILVYTKELVTTTGLYEIFYYQSISNNELIKTSFWFNEDVDMEGKIWRYEPWNRIIKNKHAIILNDYMNTCDPEEAIYLKLKYL